MQTYKNILKYLRQDNGGSFVVKFSIGAVVALLFVALTLSVQIPGAHAASATPCAQSDQRYTVVQGDTLSWIAYRFHTTWSNLATYGRIENPDMIFVGQVVCIPVQGFSTNTQVQQVRTTPHVAPIKPVQQVQQPQPTAPVVVTPTSVPYTPSPTATPAPSTSNTGNTGSIPAIINQVFGANGVAAINVARCESGLNPAAYNPSGAMGLFQIMPGTWAGTSEAGSSPYNAYANAVAAHEIFVRDGYSWREWTCKP